MSNGNGEHQDVWGRHLAEYLRRNWILIIALFSIGIYVAETRAQTRDRYTGTQAAKDRAEIMLVINNSVMATRSDISDIKADIRILKNEVLELHEVQAQHNLHEIDSGKNRN
jgi:hypothetical protein